MWLVNIACMHTMYWFHYWTVKSSPFLVWISSNASGVARKPLIRNWKFAYIVFDTYVYIQTNCAKWWNRATIQQYVADISGYVITVSYTCNAVTEHRLIIKNIITHKMNTILMWLWFYWLTHNTANKWIRIIFTLTVNINIIFE